MRQTAIQIVKILQNAGHQAVFAGGCVRDQLLGIEPKDFDIATDADLDNVERVLSPIASAIVPVGKQFGVIRVIVNGFEFEIARFRRDAKTGDGRRPDSVEFSSMEEDAKRRDLSINALFEEPITGEIFDFVGGREDLLNKRIRFVGNANERIEEDALRMLRAVRFAAKFNAILSDSDSLAISDNAWRVEVLSGERIFDEMTKILRLHKPRQALTMLSELGLLEQVLPEVQALAQCLQGPPWHCEGSTVQRILGGYQMKLALPEPLDITNPEHFDKKKFQFNPGNAFEHTIRVLEALPSDASDELLWGALLHDIGKPRTSAPSKSNPDSFSFHGHESVGAEMTIEMLKDRFKCSNDFVFTVSELIRNHMKLHSVREFRTCTLRRFLATPNLSTLIQLGIADEMGCILAEGKSRDLSWVTWIEEARIRLGSLPASIVTGKTLIEMGLKPGPLFKKILSFAFDWQLEGIDETTILKRVKGIS